MINFMTTDRELISVEYFWMGFEIGKFKLFKKLIKLKLVIQFCNETLFMTRCGVMSKI